MSAIRLRYPDYLRDCISVRCRTDAAGNNFFDIDVHVGAEACEAERSARLNGEADSASFHELDLVNDSQPAAVGDVVDCAGSALEVFDHGDSFQ